MIHYKMDVAILAASILILATIEGKAYEMRMPLYNRRTVNFKNIVPVTNFALQHHMTVLQKKCYTNNVLTECPVYPLNLTGTKLMTSIDRTVQSVVRDQYQVISNAASENEAQINPNTGQPLFRKMVNQNNDSSEIPLPLYGKLDGSSSQVLEQQISASVGDQLNIKLDSLHTKRKKFQVTTESFQNITLSRISSKEDSMNAEMTTARTEFQSSTVNKSWTNVPISEKFSQSLDSFERKFYAATFSRLSSISPPARRDNGMSYVQSGLFLQLALIALSTEVGPETRLEIDHGLELHASDQEKVELINATVSSLPSSSDDLKFRWSSRLVLHAQDVSEQFRANAASALHLKIDRFNGTETPKDMTDTLNHMIKDLGCHKSFLRSDPFAKKSALQLQIDAVNRAVTPKDMADALSHMVEIDSGGAIHNTFEEDELSADVRAVLVSTLYLRARWRSAPTLLNGTRPFRDADGAPKRAARMIRLNDVMRYADLVHWDAEALEIPYSTPGLSLLMLIPRGRSLRRLVDAAVNTSLGDIMAMMRPLRVAATLPLYTLRMTLLLPNKLQDMNISRLVEAGGGGAPGSELRLSLAVQRIMFWAEAGRNAFKDDGIEWDEPPQKEMIVDRPYIFYVRWKNKTIMNGNFVL